MTQARQEYGELAKTIFVLRYLEDEGYRRRIKIEHTGIEVPLRVASTFAGKPIPRGRTAPTSGWLEGAKSPTQAASGKHCGWMSLCVGARGFKRYLCPRPLRFRLAQEWQNIQDR